MSFCAGCGSHCGCSGGDCDCGPYCTEACERQTDAETEPANMSAREIAHYARSHADVATRSLSTIRRVIAEDRAALAWWHVRREEREASERPTCPRISLKEAV